MTAGPGPDRVARAALTCIAEPADPVMGELLRHCSPAAVIAALIADKPLPWPGRERLAGTPDTKPAQADRGRPPAAVAALERARQRWTARLGEAPTADTLDAWQRDGVRFICPGDPEWPGQLDLLGPARPWGLWLRGNADLRFACLRSVSIVGTRAATAYGQHVCGEMAAALAERDWAVVSGGAYGIDSRAHQGAMAAEGITVAVLPGGVDQPYPRGHHDLFLAIAAGGVLVSELPPGRTPTRPGFLVRNRLIAALSRGTVVVEAALRSGALNTARHARDLNRPLMAVPGPVTSALSEGCHEIIREWGAVCVTCAGDVIEMLAFPGDGGQPSPCGPAGPGGPARPGGPVLPREALDPVTARVLEAIPARQGRGPARIAVTAGVDFDTAMRCLGELTAGGFVERCERGWRVRAVRQREGDTMR